MRIGIDIRTAHGEKAGKGSYTFNLVRELLKLDQKNQYFLYGDTPIPSLENVNSRQFILKKGILWHYRVGSLVKKQRIQVYFSPGSYLTPLFLPRNVRLLLAVHDLVALLFPKAHNQKAVWVEKLCLSLAVKRADKILCVSANTQKDLQNYFQNENLPTVIVPCAAATNFRPLAREDLQKFAINSKIPSQFFLAVGTLEPRKNYLHLFEAFALLQKKYPESRLLIVGKKGWYFQEIFAAVRANYLRGKVHFLGYLHNDSLVKLYNLATALVFPSFYEGFGIPPLEAMQCGCPVITSKRSSLPEVVGDAALLIDPERPEEIAGAMKILLEKPKIALELSRKGLKRAQSFSWAKSASRLLEIIQKLA